MAETIQTKQCSKCKKIKPTNEFYADLTKKFGIRSRCEKCTKSYNTIYYISKQEQKGCKVRPKRSPNRMSAKGAINNAIKRGRFSKPGIHKCVYCNQQAQEWHHFAGYSVVNHFDVVPVCKKCHYQLRSKSYKKSPISGAFIQLSYI